MQNYLVKYLTELTLAELARIRIIIRLTFCDELVSSVAFWNKHVPNIIK